MHDEITRRRYLLGTAGLAGAAGCLGGGDSDGDTDDGNGEDGGTGPQPPEILVVSTVQSWESFGDALFDDIASAPAGSTIDIAVRYEVSVTDTTANITREVRVFDTETGDEVGSDSEQVERTAEGDGRESFETGVPFDTEGWGEGEYRVEVTVSDESLGESSETESTTFELT
jgi:hypothetical protein